MVLKIRDSFSKSRVLIFRDPIFAVSFQRISFPIPNGHTRKKTFFWSTCQLQKPNQPVTGPNICSACLRSRANLSRKFGTRTRQLSHWKIVGQNIPTTASNWIDGYTPCVSNIKKKTKKWMVGRLLTCQNWGPVHIQVAIWRRTCNVYYHILPKCSMNGLFTIH